MLVEKGWWLSIAKRTASSTTYVMFYGQNRCDRYQKVCCQKVHTNQYHLFVWEEAANDLGRGVSNINSFSGFHSFPVESP